MMPMHQTSFPYMNIIFLKEWHTTLANLSILLRIQLWDYFHIETYCHFFFQNICDARLLELVDKVQACLDHNALFISLVRLNPKPPYIFGCRRI